MTLNTIGYGGVLWPAFVDALAAAGVQVVVDVRLTPWSKSAPCYRRDDLALALSQLGIGYAHDGDLGNPHQEECRADKSLAPYRQHLLAHPHTLAAVRQLLASGLTVALLCGCPASICHRLVIAEELRRLTPGLVVRHLHPPQGEDRGPAPKILGVTLHQPAPFAILHLGQTVVPQRRRPWCPVGTYLALHAAASIDRAEVRRLREEGLAVPDALMTSGIVGVARLAGVVQGPGSPPDGWGLVVEGALPICHVPCKGAAGLWQLDDVVLGAAREGWRAGKATAARRALHQELAKVVSADAAAIAAAQPAQTMAELLADSVRIYGPKVGTSMAATCWRDVQAEARLHARQQEGEHVRLRELAARLGYGSPSP